MYASRRPPFAVCAVLAVAAGLLISSEPGHGQTKVGPSSRSAGGGGVRVPATPPAPPPPAVSRMPPRSLEQYRGSLEEYNAHLERYRLKVEEQRANGALDLPTYRQNMNQYYEGLQRYQDGIKAYKESTGGSAVTQRHDPKASEEQAAAVTRHIAVVQSQASTRLAQLRLVSPPPSAPPIGPAYDFGQVRGALADAKRQTLAGLDGPDLEAMRLYVDQRFPTGEQLSVERFEWNPGGVVRADSVRALTGDVDRVYESLKTLKGI